MFSQREMSNAPVLHRISLDHYTIPLEKLTMANLGLKISESVIASHLWFENIYDISMHVCTELRCAYHLLLYETLRHETY